MLFLTVLGNTQAVPEALTAIPFFLFFPVLWCAVIWFMAQIGGWQQLANAYKIEQYPSRPIQKSHMQTIYLNKARYKGCVTISYDDYGLYMHPIILFRLGHDLLFIPWEEVTVQPKATYQKLFVFDFTRKLTFAQAPNVRVVFPKRLIEKFERLRGVQMLDD